ncbi:hypothetical protein J6590_017721 [Homalodisca vitripennis]|nr:hypothetical protein J6590_017721 [Homalodisca vitripennis]
MCGCDPHTCDLCSGLASCEVKTPGLYSKQLLEYNKRVELLRLADTQGVGRRRREGKEEANVSKGLAVNLARLDSDRRSFIIGACPGEQPQTTDTSPLNIPSRERQIPDDAIRGRWTGTKLNIHIESSLLTIATLCVEDSVACNPVINIAVAIIHLV